MPRQIMERRAGTEVTARAEAGGGGGTGTVRAAAPANEGAHRPRYSGPVSRTADRTEAQRSSTAGLCSVPRTERFLSEVQTNEMRTYAVTHGPVKILIVMGISCLKEETLLYCMLFYETRCSFLMYVSLHKL